MRMGFFAIFWHTSSVSTHAATLMAMTSAARQPKSQMPATTQGMSAAMTSSIRVAVLSFAWTWGAADTFHCISVYLLLALAASSSLAALNEAVRCRRAGQT